MSKLRIGSTRRETLQEQLFTAMLLLLHMLRLARHIQWITTGLAKIIKENKDPISKMEESNEKMPCLQFPFSKV